MPTFGEYKIMSIFDEAEKAISSDDTLELMSLQQSCDPRFAAVLVLDSSYSMAVNKSLDQLNAGLQTLREELMQDSLVASKIELGIVSFGTDVKIENNIAPLGKFTPPKLVAEGSLLAKAMIEALNLIAQKTALYKKAKISYYRPWILLITAGSPSYDNDDIDAAVLQLIDAQQHGHVTVFTVGVNNADLYALSRMSLNLNPKQLSNDKWFEFFVWLSNSLKQVAASIPGDKVSLEKSDRWAV